MDFYDPATVFSSIDGRGRYAYPPLSVHQTQSGAQPPTVNASVSALRFLFNVTLDRPDLSRRFILVRHPRKLPDVLSVEEVWRLLEAALGPKHKAALGTAYGAGCGCRRWAPSRSMISTCRTGQRAQGSQRDAVPQLLELLRLWWREGKRRGVMLPHGWLFPGRNALAGRKTTRPFVSIIGASPAPIISAPLRW